ncbi:hypothetical protein ACFO5K_10865 [Nocardia halotolerans]|uniref:Uncharacterized protein n=1 Tax=Nocardia halotolerans TaxID=1755878 RepID=A0ABV8VJ27_9NOCA
MDIPGEQTPRARTLILDPDLGAVELHGDEVSTVTSVFGDDETSPWRARRPAVE